MNVVTLQMCLRTGRYIATGARFADINKMDKHKCGLQSEKIKIIPQTLSVSELKKHLHERGCSTSGNKATLCTHLEGELTVP